MRERESERERVRESENVTIASPGYVESQSWVLTALRAIFKDHISPESIAEVQHNTIEGLSEP